MALAVTHTKVSAIADVGDATLVEPSDWNAAHTLTGAASVAQGGTGTGTALTLGSVVFAGASGVYSQDNTNFFWDDTNNILKIAAELDFQGTTATFKINTTSRLDFSLTNTDYWTLGGLGLVVDAGSGSFNSNLYLRARNAGVAKDSLIYGDQNGNLVLQPSGGGISLSGVAGLGIDQGSGSANATLSLTARNAGTAKLCTILSDQNGILKLQSNTSADIVIQPNGTTGWQVSPNSTVYQPPTTVAGLPAAQFAGRRAFVTDATATTFASIVAGTGANPVPVYDDGTNWRIG